VRLLDLESAPERSPACNDNDEDDDEFDDTEKVLQTQPPFQCESMDQERSRDASETDAALVPAIHLDLCRGEDVLAKDDRVRTSPAEQYDIASIEACSRESWFPENVLEIVLLSAVLGNGCAEFKIDGHTSSRYKHASNP